MANVNDNLSFFSEEELARFAPPSTPSPAQEPVAKRTTTAKNATGKRQPMRINDMVEVKDEDLPADRDRLVRYCGASILFGRECTLEQMRARLQRDFPELSPNNVRWYKYEPMATDVKDETQAAEPLVWTWPGMPSAVIGNAGEQDGGTQEAVEEAASSETAGAPVVLIPHVFGGWKGNIRGYFWRVEEMVSGMRPINLLAAHDGLYEVRSTPIGTFSVRLAEAPELDVWKEGFMPAVPRIPGMVLSEVLDFFRRSLPNEAVVDIYWDVIEKIYRVVVPRQEVTPGEVKFTRSLELQMETRFLRTICLHSHGAGGTLFSVRDDEDEKATGLYGVIGRLDTPFPEIRCRFSCGGKYRLIDARTIFEDLPEQVVVI